MRLVKPGRSAAWTKDRIEGLTTPEVRQLRDNAQRLSEEQIVGLCDEVLKGRPRGGAKAAKQTTKRPAAA
ncbi:MAG: hypothetical protein ACREUS_06120 [Burkholderiales bacterium]